MIRSSLFQWTNKFNKPRNVRKELNSRAEGSVPKINHIHLFFVPRLNLILKTKNKIYNLKQ